ncbi:MAG TPA: NAD(P)/FAD-dependent oxidoreductase [Chthoniobacterales bacterium]
MTDLPDNNEAAVIGSGPNGLAAAIALARKGARVTVFEARATIGGAVRSEELTLPGFIHDVCSSVYPMAIGSPFFRELPLQKHGLEWAHPRIPLAHPLDGGEAAVLYRSVRETADELGSDGTAYRSVMQPLADRWDVFAEEILGPMLHLPRHPILLARFGLNALQPVTWFANGRFRGARAKALFAGLAAHSFLPLDAPSSSAIGLVLGAAGHAVGWPFASGGSRNLSAALGRYLEALGGVVRSGTAVSDLQSIGDKRAFFFDTSPRQLLDVCGKVLPVRYAKKLSRFKYGPGVFKIDYALSEPIPWAAEACRKAGTIHVGGTIEEIRLAEACVAHGAHPEHPFVLVGQPGTADASRAPAGKHTAWAYCHVPNGSERDMTALIEAQIERFAPGFRDVILARHSKNTAEFQRYNANLIGGEINGGLASLAQLIARPIFHSDPYRVPGRNIWLCSASTPPGGGVHGMCGWRAACSALGTLKFDV